VIRPDPSECDLLYVTGGEPTPRLDLADLLAHARSRGIRYLAMNTNAVRLREHEEIPGLLDNLVISLDDLDYALALMFGIAFQYFTIKPMRDLSVGDRRGSLCRSRCFWALRRRIRSTGGWSGEESKRRCDRRGGRQPLGVARPKIVHRTSDWSNL
jgi:hypothetical protein